MCANCELFLATPSGAPFAQSAEGAHDRIGRVHLRTPSTAKGSQSFIWAVVFFLFLFFGMKSIGIDSATSLVVALVSGFVIFLLVRTRGDVED